ncbi:MAG: chemotaxis protein CheD [Gammaproteobacteria bacterium]|nr:chemotaxis protein CheD [Gammaproteobacteria bacterium]
MSENKIKYVSGRHVIEPGGFYFGKDEEDIYTLLGSCVAVTMWHPVLHIAGMCHIILPKRNKELDHTRFADGAIKKFIQEIERYNTLPMDYEVGLYGGGDMFPSFSKKSRELIGEKNFKETERLLLLKHFNIKFKDVGGEVARKLTLNRVTGTVSLEYVKLQKK